jgi:hypothetical protein
MNLDEMVLQVDMLLKELAFVRQSLGDGIGEMIIALQSGRSAQGVKIFERLSEFQSLHLVFIEILGELEGLQKEVKEQLITIAKGGVPKSEFEGLIVEPENLNRDLARDQQFCQQLSQLFERLAFISEQEKVTPLTVAPIVDLWEEIKG